MPDYSLRDPDVFAFIAIPMALVAAFAWGIAAASRRAGEPAAVATRATVVVLGAAAWMAAAWVAADSGVLRRWDATPPPFALLVIAVIAMACLIVLSRYGRLLAVGVPLWALIAIQTFRLPLELAMHGLYERGIMPEQMTYTGLNVDIVTGATAPIVAAVLLTGRGRWLAVIWNALGLALLVNVVTIAILSTPRFQYFGPDRLNVFVTYPPFVWLPTVMVVAALAGHFVILRALLLTRRG